MKRFKANGKEGVDLLCSLKDNLPFKFYRFLGKRVEDSPDDLHYHPKGHEYYFVLKGKIQMKVNEKMIDISENELVCVEPGEIHAVVKVTKQPCDVIIVRNEFKENDKISMDNKKWSVNNN